MDELPREQPACDRAVLDIEPPVARLIDGGQHVSDERLMAVGHDRPVERLVGNRCVVELLERVEPTDPVGEVADDIGRQTL